MHIVMYINISLERYCRVALREKQKFHIHVAVKAGDIPVELRKQDDISNYYKLTDSQVV